MEMSGGPWAPAVGKAVRDEIRIKVPKIREADLCIELWILYMVEYVT